MWIESLRLRGFGMYTDAAFRFRREGINLFLDRNERGKTTLLQGILAALFGLHRVSRGRRLGLQEEEIYRPWAGGPYVVEGVFRDGDGPLTVRRDLEAREVTIHRGGKDVTAGFREGKSVVALGPRLAGGLDRDLFLKTFCVTHAGLEPSDFSGLADPVERALGSREGATTAEDAIGVLRSALDSLGKDHVPVRGHNQADRTVRALDGSVAELEAETAILLESRRRREQERARRLAAGDHPDRIGEQIALLQFLHDRAALAGARRGVEALERAEADREEKAARLEALRPWLERPLHRNDLGAMERAAARAGASRTDAEGLEARLGEARRARAALEAEEAERFPGEIPGERELGRLRDAVVAARERDADLREASETEAREAAALQRAGVSVEEAVSLTEAFERVPEEHEFLHEASARSGSPREELETQIGTLEEARRRAAAYRSPFLGSGLGLLAAGVLCLAASGDASPVLRVAGWAAVAAGAFLASLSFRRASTERRRAAARIEAVRERLRTEQEAEREREVRLRLACERAGLPRDGVERAWRRYLRLRGQVESLRRARCDRSEARERLDREFGGQAGTLSRLGVTAQGPPLPALERGLEAARAWSELRERVISTRRQVELLEVELAEKSRASNEALAALREIARAAGADVGHEDAEDLVRRYREDLDRREEGERLRDETLPEIEARIAALRAGSPAERAASLERAVRDGLGRHSEWRDREAADPPDVYEERRRAAEARREAARDALEAFEMEVAEEEARFRDRYRSACEELEEKRRDLRRARRMRAALELALGELEEISSDTYAAWSREINPRVSRLAAALLPGFESFEFAPDLGWTLRLAGSPPLDQDGTASLSEGARSQLLLAIRLAVAGYLGEADGDGGPPLLLDDPFVHFDDERCARAVEVLLDQVAPRRQVFLFTCHEARCRALSARLGERLSAAVHEVEREPAAARAAREG